MDKDEVKLSIAEIVEPALKWAAPPLKHYYLLKADSETLDPENPQEAKKIVAYLNVYDAQSLARKQPRDFMNLLGEMSSKDQKSVLLIPKVAEILAARGDDFLKLLKKLQPETVKATLSLPNVAETLASSGKAGEQYVRDVYPNLMFPSHPEDRWHPIAKGSFEPRK